MSYHFAEVTAPTGAPLLFLLHGTGGDETDLLDLGRQLLPAAHLISPRGDVLEGGAPRFFKRLGMGVYDMADLDRATGKMAAFMTEHVGAAEPSFVAALGYSNGANILASVLFRKPQLVDRAVLMHPLIPFEPPAQPGLAGQKVLITAGRRDPIAPVAMTDSLARYFSSQGAAAALAWHDGGHEIARPELTAIRDFLAAPEPRRLADDQREKP
jgi:phospholipase/carboxylesterase